MTAFADCGLDPAFYALRRRPDDEVLPWSHIDMGCSREHLQKERDRAYENRVSQDCRAVCANCGALKLLERGARCHV